MNRLTACIIAIFMILTAAIMAAFVVPYISYRTPMYGVPLLVPSFALLIGACLIIERVTRHRPKMRDKE